MIFTLRSANRGGKRTGLETEETVLRSRNSGAKKDTGNQLEGIKEETRRDGQWKPVEVGDVQVDSRPDPRRERGIRVQQSGEAQSNGGGWGGGRIQDLGGGKG